MAIKIPRSVRLKMERQDRLEQDSNDWMFYQLNESIQSAERIEKMIEELKKWAVAILLVFVVGFFACLIFAYGAFCVRSNHPVIYGATPFIILLAAVIKKAL
jgi:predicted membrane protein